MAYDDVFVGQIVMLPFNFPPKGFAFCDGTILSIAQNTALFSLLGTTYGGNGQTTFALPDLRGRAPFHAGQGPGLSSRDLGEVTGSEQVTLTTNQIPAHTHTVNSSVVATARAHNAPANQVSPAQNVPAVEAGTLASYSNQAPDATMSASALATAGAITITPSGGDDPHENRRPYLTINYCIALQGIYPSRS